jgi:dTMP kinase
MHAFITFEGGEGTGKSTQVSRLFAVLQERGILAILTREPGGSPGAEAIRALLVQGQADRWDALTETLLLVAARRDHWLNTIAPALDKGWVVLCDRFIDSTWVYQGVAGGVDPDFLTLLHQKVLPVCIPSRTFIFDLEPEVGLTRTQARTHAENRFESKTLAYHQKLREGYQAIAAHYPERCRVLDAAQSIEKIHQDILMDLGLVG